MTQSLNQKISTRMLLKFAFPTIISMIFIGLYTTIDGIFVSRLVGTDGLSAVNIMMPFISITLAIGTMFGTGGSAVVAKKMGEGESGEARKNFTLICITALIISVVISILLLIFLEPLIFLFGADQLLFPYCFSYGAATVFFIPSVVFSVIFQSFFIADGKAYLGLIFSVIGGVINIVLDYVMIAVLDWGISGAAVATGIGYTIPTIIGIFYFLFHRKGTLFFVKPQFDKYVILKSCSNGSSEMITSISVGITTLLFNIILMKLIGSDGVAAVTILLYAYSLLSSAYMGYAIGIAPIISFSYGMKKEIRLQKIYQISLKTIFVASAFTFIFALVTSSYLVRVFAPIGSGVYELALKGYHIFSICFLFMGFNIYSSAMFTALSNGKVSACISLLRTLIFVVASLIILPALTGITGIWLAIPVAEMLGLFVSIYCFKRYRDVYRYGNPRKTIAKI